MLHLNSKHTINVKHLFYFSYIIIGDFPNNYLIFSGDSGYRIEPWLITPLLDPQTRSEIRFNSSHKSTRCKVENCIGLMKNVFRCLSLSGGVLQYDPEKVCKFITAVSVLHNIRRRLRLQEDENFQIRLNENENIPAQPNQTDAQLTIAGNAIRQHIILTYFN